MSLKKILDYKCKKAIITDEDGNEMTYWYTEEIKPATTDKNTSISELPGMPLEYSIDKDGMTMSFKVKSVDEKLDKATKNDKLNLTIPEGYEEMTYDEFSSSMGGM